MNLKSIFHIGCYIAKLKTELIYYRLNAGIILETQR